MTSPAPPRIQRVGHHPIRSIASRLSRNLLLNPRGEPARWLDHRTGGTAPMRPCRAAGVGTRGDALGPRFSKEILRKEVIQPQVPLRLPCYDLVPITGLIFGACPFKAPATSDAPRFGGLTGGVYKAQEHIHRGVLIRDY